MNISSKNKLISVNIVTRNRASLLKYAILSVLKQSYKNFEIIIIDDDSTDNTKEIVNSIKDKRIKYFKVKKQPALNIARNLAITYSSGKYIAVLDDDDEWIDDDKLKKQLQFLENNPEYGLVGTGAICYDKNNKYLFKYLKPKTNKEIKKLLLGNNTFIHSTVLFNKNLAKIINFYDSGNLNTDVSEDYNLFLKLGTVSKLYNLPNYSIKYIINQNSHSNSNIIKTLKTTIKLANYYKKYYPKNRYYNLLRNYLKLFYFGYFKKIILLIKK